MKGRQAGAHAGVLAAQQVADGAAATLATASHAPAHALAMEHVYRYLQRFYVDMSSTTNLTRQASPPARSPATNATELVVSNSNPSQMQPVRLAALLAVARAWGGLGRQVLFDGSRIVEPMDLFFSYSPVINLGGFLPFQVLSPRRPCKANVLDMHPHFAVCWPRASFRKCHTAPGSCLRFCSRCCLPALPRSPRRR